MHELRQRYNSKISAKNSQSNPGGKANFYDKSTGKNSIVDPNMQQKQSETLDQQEFYFKPSLMMNNDLKSYRSTRSFGGKKPEEKILLMTLTDKQTILTPNQSGSEIDNNMSKKRLQLLNEVGGKTIPEEEAQINDVNASQENVVDRQLRKNRIFSAGVNSVQRFGSSSHGGSRLQNATLRPITANHQFASTQRRVMKNTTQTNLGLSSMKAESMGGLLKQQIEL